MEGPILGTKCIPVDIESEITFKPDTNPLFWRNYQIVARSGRAAVELDHLLCDDLVEHEGRNAGRTLIETIDE